MGLQVGDNGFGNAAGGCHFVHVGIGVGRGAEGGQYFGRPPGYFGKQRKAFTIGSYTLGNREFEPVGQYEGRGQTNADGEMVQLMLPRERVGGKSRRA